MKNNVFDGGRVMTLTFHHMIRAIDISIRKTIARLDEVDEKDGTAVLQTLSNLNRLRATHVKYMESNPKLFQKEY